MKVLFSVGKAYYPIHESFVQRIKDLGVDVTVLMVDENKSKELIIENIKNATIYITAVALADREVIDAAPELKYIIKTGTGVDNIDVAYATQKGIIVSNAAGQNANAVAELAIGLMISLSRTIPQLDQKTKDGKWVQSTGFELKDKTLGIIGFGSIGQIIAHYAKVFDMKMIAYGNHRDDAAANKLGVNFVEFDQLLSDSDYIVVGTSLKKSTYHLIDKQALSKMKESAFLINISRGAVVDGKALFEALEQRKISGAALDVFETEPPTEELHHLDNLIATPHVGGTTLESANRIAEVTVENIRRFVHHEPLQNVLNQKELEAIQKI
ncbi:2-hydroxyacid dehydrogenase [Bacillus sp. 03113]|uniref:2-hydroxyacid dehydrogenase n=1 Tax=Bacillus sp. 03113 TaxID=2578211 RepID=UPI001143F3FF|nr:phosphoglycerate dehydrogenase [Bacillus sp. 03113]